MGLYAVFEIRNLDEHHAVNHAMITIVSLFATVGILQMGQGMHRTCHFETVAKKGRKKGLWRNSALEWEDFSEYKIDLHLFNIVMENGPFIDDFPINTSIYKGIFHGYVSHNQMVRPPFHSSHPLSVTRKKTLKNCWLAHWPPADRQSHRQEKTDFGFYCCSQLLAVFLWCFMDPMRRLVDLHTANISIFHR